MVTCSRFASGFTSLAIRSMAWHLLITRITESDNRSTASMLMKPLTKLLLNLQAAFLALFLAFSGQAEPLKIGYSDWPGFTIFEVGSRKPVWTSI